MMRPTELKPDVLIVGASVAGTLLAHRLVRQGLDVLLVERSAKPRKIFKGEFVQPAAVEAFRSVGLADVLKAKSSTEIVELRFRDLGPNNEVKSDLLMGYPQGTFARSILHHDLMTGLFAANEEKLGERFWPGGVLTPKATGRAFWKKPEFTLDHPSRGKVEVKPRWVVGCDGRNSSIAKWIHLSQDSKDARVTLLGEREFIMGVELPQKAPLPERYEVIRSHKRGTVSAFALGEQGQRIYFSSPERPQLAKAAGEELRQLMRELQPMAEIGVADDSLAVMGSPADTTSYIGCGKGRVLLAGDAVAVTTPYGGQGMTVACEHGKALSRFPFASEDARAIRFGLAEYDREIRRTYARVNLLNFGLYHLFFSRRATLKIPTHHVIVNWTARPELAERVMRLFAGQDLDRPGVLELLDLWGLKKANALFDPFAEAVRRSAHGFTGGFFS